MTVYFVQAGKAGPIKIGFALNPRRRLYNLQIGHPEKLSLIGLIEGGREIEAELHDKFKGQRIRGEWFRKTDSLMGIIPPMPRPRARVYFSDAELSGLVKKPMTMKERLTAIETRCEDVGVSMASVCKTAAIDYSTYWRWRERGNTPPLDLWERFTGAADTLCGNAEDAPPSPAEGAATA